MPPKKTTQKKTPRFTAKLNTEQKLKKELNREKQDEQKLKKLNLENKDEKKILKNLLIKNVENDIDEEEETKIRMFLKFLNKKRIDSFAKEIKNFIYENPTEYRVKLFEKINENLRDKEKKLLFLRYLNQEDMPLEIIYNDFIIRVRQDEIVRNFLTILNNIYTDTDEIITKNKDDKALRKTLIEERNNETLKQIDKFKKQKNVLPSTVEIIDSIIDKMPTKKMFKLIKLYLKQRELSFKQFYDKFLDEDYDELELKEFFSSKEFEDIIKFKSKKDVILKLEELVEKDPEKENLIKNINKNLDMYLIRRLIRTYLDQFYENPRDRFSFEVFVNRFFDDNYIKMYKDREAKIKLLIEKQTDEKETRKQKEIDLLFEEDKTSSVIVDLINITKDRNLIAILNGPVTKDIKDYATEMLSQNLLKVSNMRIDYNLDSEYIVNVIDIASHTSKNVRDFIEKIGNIIVYLISGLYNYEVITGNNQTILKTNDVFIKNIKSVFYEPDSLLVLTPEQKLPEIFMNTRVTETQKSNVLYAINLKLKRFIINFIEHIYNYRNLFVRVDYKGTLPVIKDIDTIISESFPFDLDMIQFENDNVIYYDPNLNKTFLLDIEDVLRRIENREYINKLSNTPFHPDFIKNVGYMYRRYKKTQEDYTNKLKEEENMIKYFDTDLKKVIKFNKSTLWKQFEEGNYINEITNKPFDPNFVKELQILREILLRRKREEANIEKITLEREQFKEKMINYPTILNELFDDLEQMENL